MAFGQPGGWISRIVFGIVLLNCCAWSGFGSWLLAPFSAWSANQFDRLHGDLENIAPAEWQPACNGINQIRHS